MKQLYVYKKNRKSWFLYYPIYNKYQEQYLLERYSHAPYKTVIVEDKKVYNNVIEGEICYEKM